MLTSRLRAHTIYDEQDFVHNYYERLVLEEVLQQSSRAREDRDFMADVSCVALNRLPPRYIRHDVDMTFFMSPQEIEETEFKIRNAVDIALNYVEKRERGEPAELPALSTSFAALAKDKKEVAGKTGTKKNKR
ncbi:MAG TPA: late competence development ComFB family protein [Cellvibrio sp.]|nr:late competence development ComFB family protein [Cellvibrio sp.]